MKHRILCLSACLALPAFASEEPFRLLPESFKLSDFSASASGAFTGDVDLKAGGAFSVSNYSFSVAQQVQTGADEDTGFLVGFTYDRIDINQTKPNARTPLPDQLQSVSLDLIYQHRVADQWLVQAGLTPRMAGAGSSFGSDGFGIGGSVLAIWEFRPNLSFSFGGGYETLNGESAIFPQLGMEWIINPTWTVLLGFPETAVVYSPSERWSFALLVEGVGGTYYVEKDPAPGAVGRPSLKDSTLTYEDLRVGLSARHQLTDAVSLSATVGYLMSGEFEYESPGYKVETDGGALYGGFAVEVSF
jgi:hypothetical protein